MRFAGMKELKQKTRELLKAAEKEDVIITAYGKPTAVLHHVDADDLDDYLFENDPAFKRKIEELWREYLAVGGTPIEKIIEDLEKRRVSQEA
ncbi:MAG TPA: type II toxin-antitoxin system prevent-host-death family antitoxin [Candidatus Desulfaltia sp.]|nr:type II toxin-antitoxin system prevent-host-death family antitoxin [Candidatus Desulfaltia sp.]